MHVAVASGEKTTVNLIGNGMLALLRHRDQLASLRANPEIMPTAIQEFLRYDSPVQLSTRIPSEGVVFGDKTIPAGSLVFVSIGAANRDPLLSRLPETPVCFTYGARPYFIWTTLALNHGDLVNAAQAAQKAHS